jgi:hypothetical protein
MHTAGQGNRLGELIFDILPRSRRHTRLYSTSMFTAENKKKEGCHHASPSTTKVEADSE